MNLFQVIVSEQTYFDSKIRSFKKLSYKKFSKTFNTSLLEFFNNRNTVFN